MICQWNVDAFIDACRQLKGEHPHSLCPHQAKTPRLVVTMPRSPILSGAWPNAAPTLGDVVNLCFRGKVMTDSVSDDINMGILTMSHQRIDACKAVIMLMGAVPESMSTRFAWASTLVDCLRPIIEDELQERAARKT